MKDEAIVTIWTTALITAALISAIGFYSCVQTQKAVYGRGEYAPVVPPVTATVYRQCLPNQPPGNCPVIYTCRGQCEGVQ